MQQHRTIEVGDATLECTLYGSGTIVLPANAGEEFEQCDAIWLMQSGGG
jgi:hypothetical protein